MFENLSLSDRFKLGFVLNSAFMVAEYAMGLLSGSLILLADATHNLTDSVTLAISWLGNRIARKPADPGHTLGHGRAAVLTAFINCLILVIIAIGIFIEAYHRFTHPAHLSGGIIAITGAVGILVNSSVASLFYRDKRDINVRAAFTNMAFDAIFSVAALIGGVLIALTHLTWIDPVISIGVSIGLLYAAFGILGQATNIFLEGVPKDLDLAEIRRTIADSDNVSQVTDLYVWAISSNEYILCCSITPETSSLNKLNATTKTLKNKLYDLGFAKVIIETTG